MTNLLWCLLAIFVPADAHYTYLTETGKVNVWVLTLGRQPSPWDVAFDRTLDFLLSNFSTHDFVWTLPIGVRPFALTATGFRKPIRRCGSFPLAGVLEELLHDGTA